MEGDGHTPYTSYTWRQHTDWVRSGKYQQFIKRGTQELQRICDKIIAEDPGSIILLLGDHGPTRFRKMEEGVFVSSLAGLIAQIQAQGISLQDWVDDRHAVFLGIRLPYGQREDISHGLPMSHVNLFRHVFAYLNEDTGILKSREPSNSYWRDFAIVKEGKVAGGS